jgi:flagellar M-ring protein FliF
MERRARIGLVVGLIAILALVGGVALWAYRPDYQVLFADLAPRDAAAMTSELDKMKVDYKLGANGTSILVPRDLVYRTRLKLMGGNLPLQGAVGFEVFNNTDFGMTEFVQRVNYLRAVQGELTRTIQSIDGIQGARVHLAIPEQGLFKKSAATPKASVTLTMKPNQELSTQQISGIQRLVAASVPDVASKDVTVLDQHGVALTRQGSDAGDVGADAQLDVKRSTEEYLQRKIGAVLDRTFGPGEAMATVDVALIAEHGSVTTEEVLPAQGAANLAGIIVRQRTSAQDGGGTSAATPERSAGTANNSEIDYQVGRRVEQRTVPGGAIKRMTVAVVVKQGLDAVQLGHLRDVVAVTSGLNQARGDAIVVTSVGQLANPQVAIAAEPVPSAASLEDRASTAPTALRQIRPAGDDVVLALAGFLSITAAGAAIVLTRRRRAVQDVQPMCLDEAARARMLADVRRWIANPDTVDLAERKR